MPVEEGEVLVPYQEFTSATLFFYDGSVKIRQLDTESMRKYLDSEGKMLVAPVKLSLYDTLGRSGTRILADSGRTNDSMEEFEVWGDVYVRTANGQIIQTQRLSWNKSAQRVTSNAFVQIQTPKGDVLRGKGLDAVEDFSSWSLRESVSGRFPEFRRRVEQDDGFL